MRPLATLLLLALGGCATTPPVERFVPQVREDSTEVPVAGEPLWSFRIDGEGPFFSQAVSIDGEDVVLNGIRFAGSRITELQEARVGYHDPVTATSAGLLALGAAALPWVLLSALANMN